MPPSGGVLALTPPRSKSGNHPGEWAPRKAALRPRLRATGHHAGSTSPQWPLVYELYRGTLGPNQNKQFKKVAAIFGSLAMASTGVPTMSL